MHATACKILPFPVKPGFQPKRIRRKKCPDELLPLPSPPKLYETDPVMLADVEGAAQAYRERLEKYRDRLPYSHIEFIMPYLGAGYMEWSIQDTNECLLKEARIEEQKIRDGIRLVSVKKQTVR